MAVTTSTDADDISYIEIIHKFIVVCGCLRIIGILERKVYQYWGHIELAFVVCFVGKYFVIEFIYGGKVYEPNVCAYVHISIARATQMLLMNSKY